MKKEDLKDGIFVVNKRYGSLERVLSASILMKDTKKGWVSAVLYQGPDRNSLFNDVRTFCKERKAFLNEFELSNELYPYPDQGFGKCPFCGGTLGWSNEFMFNDIYDTPEFDKDDEPVVTNLTCTQCGSLIVVYEPDPEDKKRFPFWDMLKKNK